MVVGCEEMPVVTTSTHIASSPRQTPTTISVVVNDIANAAASLTGKSVTHWVIVVLVKFLTLHCSKLLLLQAHLNMPLNYK